MIIGISGKIGSGKDLIGQIIQYLVSKDVAEKGYLAKLDVMSSDMKSLDKFINVSGWQIKKFSGKLKDIVCILIGCTREQLEDRTFKETPLGEEWWYWQNSLGKIIPYLDNVNYNGKLIKLTPRLLLQLLGTQCGREIIHPNIWVNALFADYKLPFDDSNWKDYLPNWIITDVRFPNEVKAIKDRGGIIIRVNRPIAGILSNHESEISLDDYRHFDFYINNGGTIEDLIEKVRSILISKKFIH